MFHVVFVGLAVVLLVLAISGDFWKLLKARQYRRLLIATVLTLGLGTVYYSTAEAWSLVDSFYFSVVSLLTVGYGDFVPTTPATKLFTVLYLLIGISLLLSFVNVLAQQHFLISHERIKVLIPNDKTSSDDRSNKTEE